MRYAISNAITVHLTLVVSNAAVQSRNPAPSLIHHSDRGYQYAVKPYRNRLGRSASAAQ